MKPFQPSFEGAENMVFLQGRTLKKIMIFTKNAKRTFLALSFFILVIVFYHQDLKKLLDLSLNNNEYNHILLIPIVSLYFLYSKRDRIFSYENKDNLAGMAILMMWVLVLGVSRWLKPSIESDIYLSLSIFSFVILLISAFVITFGVHSFRKVSFPLLFLFFLVPIPTVGLDQIVAILIRGSADISDILFQVTGIPFFREGFVFHLPRITVEVAKQCSGIRSTTALFITAILASHLFLRRFSSKLIFVLAVFPVAIFKNGMRIVTLSILGAYVDKAWLTDSFLHRRGGIVFFMMALAIMITFIFFLRKIEMRGNKDDHLSLRGIADDETTRA